MLKNFKTILLAASVLVAGIFANGDNPEPSTFSPDRINYSTTAIAPSTPREENAETARPKVNEKKRATGKKAKNPEDDDCVVIETPQSTPHKHTAASDSLGATPDCSDIQSNNSTANNTPPSTPRSQIFQAEH